MPLKFYVVVYTGPESSSLDYKELLENEKSNFRLVNSAVTFLGGVPAMINTADMSNTIPNEKVRVAETPKTISKTIYYLQHTIHKY